MAVTKEFFGKTKAGQEIDKFWIENKAGMKAAVINFGGILTNLFVKDKNGTLADVVLGYDDFASYERDGNCFGAIVGPSANRISGAAFEIDGVVYEIDKNNGENNLHSHFDLGYHKRVFDAAEGTDSVCFSLKDEDGSLGFPGNRVVKVTYTLNDENELHIHYEVTSDKKTLINMTNHSYFNLKGQGQGDVLNHVLEIKSSHTTKIREGMIPTGELFEVVGTALDFTAPKTIGQDIQKDEEQMKLGYGYDHNFVIAQADGTMREAAIVTEPTTGRTMKVYTTLPGVQFYAANGMNQKGAKGGVTYGPKSAFCLETQYFPDSIHQPEFPSVVFGPDRKYDSETVYKFC